MAISLLQTKTKGDTLGTSTTVTWTNNTTSGSLVVVVYASNAAAISVTSVTDSQNNTYVKAYAQVLNPGVSELWYCGSIAAGTTPTITVNHLNEKGAVVIREFTNAGIGFNLQRTASQNNTTATAHSSSATTSITTDIQLVVGTIGLADQGANLTASGSFGNLSQIQTAAPSPAQAGFEYLLTTAVGTQNASFATVSGVSSACGVATFVNGPLPTNNYQFVKAPDGLSVSEKIR